VDSENWHSIERWEWDFGNEGWICWEPAECASAFEPKVLFTETIGGIEYLFHGEREVRLSVWDDDGAGGEDFPSSTTSKTVTVANIPPYAAFTWSDQGNWSELVFPLCTRYLRCLVPPGPPGQPGPPSDYYCLDHDVASEPGCGGVFAPWSWVEVKVGIHSTEELVEITEEIPSGWSYWLIEYDDECVTITEQGEDYWKATIEPIKCPQYPNTEIRYELYPPYEGPLGSYSIETSAVHDGVIEPTVYTPISLQAQVIATQWLQLHGYGNEVYFIDPNGDEIVSWDWQGPGAIASGQDPTGGYCSEGWCEFAIGDPMIGLPCQFDSERWGWFWSRDLPISLTVTDALGASTTVMESIPLSGFCGTAPA
jgi:hypothetical protein